MGGEDIGKDLVEVDSEDELGELDKGLSGWVIYYLFIILLQHKHNHYLRFSRSILVSVFNIWMFTISPKMTRITACFSMITKY